MTYFWHMLVACPLCHNLFTWCICVAWMLQFSALRPGIAPGRPDVVEPSSASLRKISTPEGPAILDVLFWPQEAPRAESLFWGGLTHKTCKHLLDAQRCIAWPTKLLSMSILCLLQMPMSRTYVHVFVPGCEFKHHGWQCPCNEVLWFESFIFHCPTYGWLTVNPSIY